MQAELIELNIGVAHAVARRYRGRGVPLEDLEQVACEGLVKAVRRFDPSLHHHLLSYVVPTIRGEVQRYFRDLGWMVRPPRRVQELQSTISAASSSLASDHGRDATPEEVCAHLSIEREDYDEALRAMGCFQPTSLDQSLDQDRGSLTLGDTLEMETDVLAAAEARAVLAALLVDLDPRDRRILWLSYMEDRTQREIGDQLGVAQMQVSRWLSRVLSTLRSQLASDVSRTPA